MSRDKQKTKGRIAALRIVRRALRREEGVQAFLIFSSILKTPFVDPTKRRL
jgi:hypothetical protein